MTLIHDILERLNIFFVGCSASGWLTFIVAFGSQQLSLDPVTRAVSFLVVPWWFAAAAGPILYILLGIHMLLGPRYRVGGIFGSFQATFGSFIYVVALAAPLFAVATLGLTAATALDEALSKISIPDLSDSIDLGPFSFGSDAVDAVVDLFKSAIKGIIYIIVLIFFDQYFTAVKSIFVGSFTSMFFLVCSMMLWPFMKPSRYPGICKSC